MLRTLLLCKITAVAMLFMLAACSNEDNVEQDSAVPLTQSSSGIRPVNGERIRNADAEPGNWLSHGRTYDEQHFSPLAYID